MTICPKHKRDLTVDWRGRKSSTCCYPSHNASTQASQGPTPCQLRNVQGNLCFTQCCCPSWVHYLCKVSYRALQTTPCRRL
ncbi:unnamed protein product [Porites evermanni]|uniref:Uncharacterized protein n=1 Tax=Porites evermanni TaxID=104178 RepID=A0ABN8M6W2_9CNID|nr:unnamed protein product [Porites evermanni]